MIGEAGREEGARRIINSFAKICQCHLPEELDSYAPTTPRRNLA